MGRELNIQEHGPLVTLRREQTEGRVRVVTSKERVV